MRLFGFLSLLTVFSVSCSLAQVSSDQPVYINASLVRLDSPELEKATPFHSPYIAKFVFGKKTLTFIAASHLSIIESPVILEHPTIKTILQAFNAEKPNVIILEGLRSGNVISPQRPIQSAKKCEAEGYRNCGEWSFALNLAQKNGIPFISGEPLESEADHLILSSEKYTWEDLLGFYILRQLPQHFRLDIPKKSLEQVITEDLLYLRKTKNLKVEFGYSEFSKWYTLHSGKSILQTASIKYHYGEDATFFRDIGDKISILRNQTIVKRIETMLNQYSNVMIVYGASHLLEEMPALESALGKPKYYKLY